MLSSSLVLDLKIKKRDQFIIRCDFIFISPFIHPHFFGAIVYLILEPIETSIIAESLPVI